MPTGNCCRPSSAISRAKPTSPRRKTLRGASIESTPCKSWLRTFCWGGRPCAPPPQRGQMAASNWLPARSGRNERGIAAQNEEQQVECDCVRRCFDDYEHRGGAPLVEYQAAVGHSGGAPSLQPRHCQPPPSLLPAWKQRVSPVQAACCSLGFR